MKAVALATLLWVLDLNHRRCRWLCARFGHRPERRGELELPRCARCGRSGLLVTLGELAR